MIEQHELSEEELNKLDDVAGRIADQIISIVVEFDPHIDENGGRHIDARMAIAACGRVMSTLMAQMTVEMQMAYTSTIKGILDEQLSARLMAETKAHVNQ